MSKDRIACKDSRYLPVAGQCDIEDEVVPGNSRDLEQLLVQRIAFDGSFGCQGFTHEQGRVNCLDGWFGCDSGNNQLPASRIAGHQMGLNKAQGDAKVGIYEVVMNVNGRFATRCSKIAMLPRGPGIVADDPIVSCDLRTDDLVHFDRRGGPMQPS